MNYQNISNLESSPLIAAGAIKWVKQIMVVDYYRAGVEWALWTLMMAELVTGPGGVGVEDVREGFRRNLGRVEGWRGDLAPPFGLYILRSLVNWDDEEREAGAEAEAGPRPRLTRRKDK